MKDERANLKVPTRVRDKVKAVATYHKTSIFQWLEQQADKEIKKYDIKVK